MYGSGKIPTMFILCYTVYFLIDIKILNLIYLNNNRIPGADSHFISGWKVRTDIKIVALEEAG